MPGELTEDEFWTRYFFRMHQIDQEEERRKAVLAGKNCLHLLPHDRQLMMTFVAGPADQDDDFSWEDEDEDAAPKVEPLPTPIAPALNRDKLLGATDPSGTMSPQRSEDSFDFVSSGHTSAAGDPSTVQAIEEGTSDGEEGEEDEGEDENEGEGEDENEGEDEDEDDEESDWE